MLVIPGPAHPNPWNPLVSSLHGLRNFAGRTKLVVLRWEIILDYLGRPDVIARILMRGRQSESEM